MNNRFYVKLAIGGYQETAKAPRINNLYSHAGVASRATVFRQLIIASPQLHSPASASLAILPRFGDLSRYHPVVMKTPLVTEVEIIYGRKSESPPPASVIDLTFAKVGKSARNGAEAPILGDGLDLEDPMVSDYAGTGGELAQDEKAAMDPSNILNGEDRLRHQKPLFSEKWPGR